VRISRWLAPLVVALVPAAVLAAGIQGIDVLSNRADLISGGDALVAARLAPGTDAAAVRVTLNGSDITSSFAVRENGQYQGLVTGLAEGDNLLRARLPDGSGHEITIKNHPIGGPVFSGEQIQPWLCRTQLQTGTTPALGASVDEKCNAAAPIVELFYRSTGNQWVAYTPTTLPELIQPTTTDEGKTVPFIIQRVTGTANRGIYQIAVLVDPSKPIEPWSTGQPWNRKYVNTFGGACSVNYQQPTVGDVRNVARLGLGFAVGTSSLNTYGNSCSDVISAEALMMTKEIITERWGPIRYTIGDGGSAGTMQQHMISGAYPGMLNGLMTSLLYEDHWFQVVDSFDCLVLSRYFGLGGAPAGWGGGGNALFNTPALRQLVYGTNPSNPDAKCSQKIGFTVAELIANSASGCSGPPNTPPWRWDPVTNPNGTRCTIQDYMKYVFGVGPDNKAPRPIDNVGLQYGLASLLNGTLTQDRFVDVNWRIGGMDIDGVWQPQRTAADLGALTALYRTGRITDGSGAAYVAEIDARTNPTDVGFHPPFHSWSWRARIDRTLGNHDNNVIWVSRGGAVPSQFDAMRTWLDTVYSDPSADPLPAKIARSKPADVRDTCYASDAQGGPQEDLFCTGTPAQWQYYGHMRMVAGMPFTLDAFKCQLKPLDPADYPGISFTTEEWAKLQEAFPTGVCDFSKPAVAQQRSLPWVSFAGGPGGQPLGDMPQSALVPASTRLTEQAELVGDAVGGSYANQLAAVQAYLAQGDIASACGALRAYGNHVRAQSGKKLSAALASELQRNATSIGQQIGCTA